MTAVTSRAQERPAKAGRVARLARLAAAAGCGLLLVAAFPPIGAWPLAVPAVAGLTLAVRGQRARGGALLGLLFGLTFFLPLLWWLRVIGPDAWLLLAAFEALYLAAMGAGLALTSRLPGWPVWTAALWVTQELVRDRWPFGGFPWGRLAFSQTSSWLTPLAAVGGAPLVTFATALVGGLVAYAIVASRRRGARAGAGLAVLLAAALPALTSIVVPAPSASGSRSVTVAVVQGNVPRLGLDFLGQREAVLRNHADTASALAADVRAGRRPAPDVVIWPENSTDIDPFADPQAYARIDAAVRDVGVPTLVGAVVSGPDPDLRYNTGLVWDPVRGPGERYVKRHPVPFGEYIPFRGLLASWISRLDRIPRDFAAGDRPGVLAVGPATVGDVICFEVAYDEIVRDVVRGGGEAVVVQTNNATYGRTGQPEQQLAMSRLRAVEHGRAVVVAATSGISAVIAPDGRVVDRSAEFTRDVLVEEVPLRSARTLATRVGAGPEWGLAIVGLLAVLGATRRTRRVDPAGGEDPGGLST